MKSIYYHILELIPEFLNMIRPIVSHATSIAEIFFLYPRDSNWIPPEYKLAMSALSQCDWNKNVNLQLI